MSGGLWELLPAVPLPTVPAEPSWVDFWVLRRVPQSQMTGMTGVIGDMTVVIMAVVEATATMTTGMTTDTMVDTITNPTGAGVTDTTIPLLAARLS